MSQGPPTPVPVRTAQQVIDTAIAENRRSEFVCFLLIVGFVLFGAWVILNGVQTGNGVVTVAGSATAALFWPALRHAIRIRETNMIIRLFEIPLAAAKTSREASAAIIMVFRNRFQSGEGHAADGLVRRVVRPAALGRIGCPGTGPRAGRREHYIGSAGLPRRPSGNPGQCQRGGLGCSDRGKRFSRPASGGCPARYLSSVMS